MWTQSGGSIKPAEGKGGRGERVMTLTEKHVAEYWGWKSIRGNRKYGLQGSEGWSENLETRSVKVSCKVSLLDSRGPAGMLLYKKTTPHRFKLGNAGIGAKLKWSTNSRKTGPDDQREERSLNKIAEEDGMAQDVVGPTGSTAMQSRWKNRDKCTYGGRSSKGTKAKHQKKTGNKVSPPVSKLLKANVPGVGRGGRGNEAITECSRRGVRAYQKPIAS